LLLKSGGPGLATKGDELQPLLAAILPTQIEKTDDIRGRLVGKLLAAGADPNASRKGVTPLLLAARHGTGDIVKALLAAGAKSNAMDYKMRDALMRAAAANQPVDVIEHLLKSGIDLNGEDSNTDRTILGTYAMHGNQDACAALIAAGADPNAKPVLGATPLLLAANGPYSTDDEALAVVRLLLKHGAKLESAVSGDIANPLYGAIVSQRSTLIRPLVDAGAQPNKALFDKVGPLALAAAASDVRTVRALLDAGADFKTPDGRGISPLGHASAAGKRANMALLLAHGASPNAETPDGIPPILMAAANGQLGAVRALIAAGADLAAIDPQSKNTALQKARSLRDESMIKLLEQISDH
jgi:ankyrin repeat protein